MRSIIYTFGALALAFFLAKNIHHLLWEEEGATVVLHGCEEETCRLHGTLRRTPWTGGYQIELADGSAVMLQEEAIAMMSWPAPKN